MSDYEEPSRATQDVLRTLQALASEGVQVEMGSQLDELGYDSIDIAEIYLTVDEHSDRPLLPDVWRSCHTVEDLIGWVRQMEKSDE